jgi:hypothetical protein
MTSQKERAMAWQAMRTESQVRAEKQLPATWSRVEEDEGFEPPSPKRASWSKIPPDTRFGKLVILFEYGVKKGQVWYMARCDCGVRKAVLGSRLRSGKTKSCGCLRKAARKG